MALGRGSPVSSKTRASYNGFVQTRGRLCKDSFKLNFLQDSGCQGLGSRVPQSASPCLVPVIHENATQPPSRKNTGTLFGFPGDFAVGGWG